MRILIHCNGGPSVGVGHVVRSLALAEEATASGHQVTFAGELEGDFIEGQLAAADVDVVPLTRAEAGTTGNGLSRVVAEVRPDVVHLDTYDEVALLDARPPGAHPFLVSNVEDGVFGRRPADVVIDPNFGSETDERDADEPRLLLRGSRYAPLRRTVTTLRGEWQLREDATRVLVVMGGTDPQRLTPRVLGLLAATDLPLNVTAIVRPDDREACEEAGEGLQLELLPPVEDLPALMVEQDLVVSAAGTSVWELCCLGVPMALVCAVDNQRPGYERVVAAGAALGLGTTLEGDAAEVAARQLRDALTYPDVRRDLARQAGGIVDGLGGWRVVRTWEQAVEVPAAQPTVTRLDVRRAAMADAETLLRWRNDPETRRSSRQQEELRLDDHLAWLEASLERDDRLLLIASDEHGDVGTVRWDREAEGEWEVSITVAPERRGRSLARPLLAAGGAELVRTTGEPVSALATVHEVNAASRRLFASSGYVPDQPADADGFLGYRKRLRRATG